MEGRTNAKTRNTGRRGHIHEIRGPDNTSTPKAHHVMVNIKVLHRIYGTEYPASRFSGRHLTPKTDISNQTHWRCDIGMAMESRSLIIIGNKL